jgi:hypothetical protein
MPADLAAGYCGERSAAAFLRRVGKEYPLPRVAEGRRRLWLKDDLDKAILPTGESADIAEDL